MQSIDGIQLELIAVVVVVVSAGVWASHSAAMQVSGSRQEDTLLPSQLHSSNLLESLFKLNLLVTDLKLSIQLAVMSLGGHSHGCLRVTPVHCKILYSALHCNPLHYNAVCVPLLCAHCLPTGYSHLPRSSQFTRLKEVRHALNFEYTVQRQSAELTLCNRCSIYALLNCPGLMLSSSC